MRTRRGGKSHWISLSPRERKLSPFNSCGVSQRHSTTRSKELCVCMKFLLSQHLSHRIETTSFFADSRELPGRTREIGLQSLRVDEFQEVALHSLRRSVSRGSPSLCLV